MVVRAGFAISLREVTGRFSLGALCSPTPLSRVVVSSGRVGHPKLRVTKCFRFFSTDHVRVVNGDRRDFVGHFAPRGTRREVERCFGCGPTTIIIYHSLRFSSGCVRVTGRYNIPILGAGRSASAFSTTLVTFLGLGLTPHVARRNILIRICNRNVLLVNRDNMNGDRATVRLMGHKRHLVTSSTIRVHHMSSGSLINATPSGVHRFVRLQKVNVVGTDHVFNTNTIGLARGVSLVVGVRR